MQTYVPYKGNWKCEAVVDGNEYTCYIIGHRGPKKSRVIKCGLPRSPKNELLLPNACLNNVRPANEAGYKKDEKPVPDGKVFNKTAIYDGEEVYLVQKGPKNSRIVAKEGTNRKSFLVPTAELRDIEGGDDGGVSAPATW